MTKRWMHPWWLQGPASALLAGFIAYALSRVGSWPSRVPLRFGRGGGVGWGSPWIAFALVVGLGVLFLTLSAVLDELWARQERRKRFNPITLLDELVIGLLVGAQAPLFGAGNVAEHTLAFPWETALLCAGCACIAAGLLEWRRPVAVSQRRDEEREPETFDRELAARLSRGERVVYWDAQNPRYVTVLSLGIPIALWVGAGLTFGSEPWAGGILAAVGLILLQFYGGQRVRVTKDDVTIRYGLAGFRVFHCRVNEISSVRIRHFAALQEFGGYGIRFAGSTIGYFLAGSRGVEIDRAGKRTVLIGSDHPKRLAAVLGAVCGIDAAEMTEEGGHG